MSFKIIRREARSFVATKEPNLAQRSREHKKSIQVNKRLRSRRLLIAPTMPCKPNKTTGWDIFA